MCLLGQSLYAPQAGLTLTVSLPHPECWNYGSLSSVFLTVCSAGRHCFLILQKRKSGSAPSADSLQGHHAGCEPQANSRAHWFLTTSPHLGTWQSKKGFFLPNRCQKYLSRYPYEEKTLEPAGSEPVSPHLKVDPSVLQSFKHCCTSPAAAQVSNTGPCSLGNQTLGITLKYTGNLYGTPSPSSHGLGYRSC